MPINKTDNKKSELAQLLLHYLPYWPYFLGSLIVCGVFSKLYLHFATPVYQISASILIKDDDQNNNNATFSSSWDLFSSKKIVENETEVLHSRTLMDEVVKNLGLYAPVYLDGTIRNKPGYTQSPVRIQLKFPDKIKISEKDEKIYFTYDGIRVTIAGKHFPLNTWKPSPWGEIRFIPNPAYIITPHAKKDPLFFTFLNVHQVAEGLISRLDVNQSGKLSTVIHLSLKDPVPERGEDIINQLIYFYNIAALKDKNKLAKSAVSFLDERLDHVAKELDSIEVALQLYKANKGGVDLSEQSKLILGSVMANDEKISEINVQLATLRQIQNYVEGNGGVPGIVPSTTDGNDEVLSKYLGNLYGAEIQYDKLRKTTAQNNPMLLSLQDQINKIKPTILQYILNKINTLEAVRNNLNNTAGQYASILHTIPQKQRELLEISRQQAIKNDLYTYLLKKREEAALSYRASVSDIRIFDKAQAGVEPVSKKRKVVFGFALILGLCIPVIFIKFNEKIFSKDDLKSIINYPMLGEIAYLSHKKTSIIANDRKNFITEQLRQVRTSLEPALGINAFKNKIMITSAVSGEGKSFIASNLAVSLALTGKKVILIDLDLHKPNLYKIFDENGETGVADFLLGKATMEEIIYKTEINKNLFLIPSGENLTEPSELILNGKLPELLIYLEGIYDYILMETAPVNVITDGYIVSKLCDATLFVARYGITPKTELVTFKENVSSKKLKNIGIIFNGVKPIGFKGYGKKYYGYMGKKEKSKKTNYNWLT